MDICIKLGINSICLNKAFNQCATSLEKFRFAQHFDLNETDFNLNGLTRLYVGLQRLLSNEAKASNRYHYSIDRRRGYFDESEFRLNSSKGYS